MTEEAVLDIVENSEITRLRKMKGIKRLWFSSEFSTYLLKLNYEQFPGIGLEFLEAKKTETEEGEWEEYKLLLRGCKFDDSLEYLSQLLETTAEFVNYISKSSFQYKIEDVGIEEIECREPDSYYILIYFISNGKDYRGEE